MSDVIAKVISQKGTCEAGHKVGKLEVPAVLKGIYKPDESRNSQQYTSMITGFAFMTNSFKLVF